MRNINKTRLALFLAVAAIHGIFIAFFAFRIDTALSPVETPAVVMKLVDVREITPVPPVREKPPEVIQNTVEAVAETIIETDEIPEDMVIVDSPVVEDTGVSEEIEYLPMHKISKLPSFSEKEIRQALVYPPIALRSGLEGMVYLELFVDSQGEIRQIAVLKEEPAGRGFGEAAVKAFEGVRGSPAQANGKAVAVRYRYPVRFAIKGS
jgi:protein TonB